MDTKKVSSVTVDNISLKVKYNLDTNLVVNPSLSSTIFPKNLTEDLSPCTEHLRKFGRRSDSVEASYGLLLFLLFQI